MAAIRCLERLIFHVKMSCFLARKLLGVVSIVSPARKFPDRPALYSLRALIRPHDLWSIVRFNCGIQKTSLFSK